MKALHAKRFLINTDTDIVVKKLFFFFFCNYPALITVVLRYLWNESFRLKLGTWKMRRNRQFFGLLEIIIEDESGWCFLRRRSLKELLKKKIWRRRRQYCVHYSCRPSSLFVIIMKPFFNYRHYETEIKAISLNVYSRPEGQIM